MKTTTKNTRSEQVCCFSQSKQDTFFNLDEKKQMFASIRTNTKSNSFLALANLFDFLSFLQCDCPEDLGAGNSSQSTLVVRKKPVQKLNTYSCEGLHISNKDKIFNKAH